MATEQQDPDPEPPAADPDLPATDPEPAPLPATATALAAKAQDLVAIRDTVVEAAGVAAGLWFSYLFVLLYLLVAAGSVTHRDLLLQSPVRLPFLNVDLPLVGFFVLGPLLFLVVHAYVLLHFVLLAGKVGVFDTELRGQIADAEIRLRLRRQLPSNVFVQFLAGPLETREGIVGIFLRLIAQISLVLGPIALLVFVQLQFLPYHQEAITWWQRVAVLIDLALLWTLWPAIAHGKTITDAWRGMRRVTVAGVGLASLVPVMLIFAIATFPGEWLESRLSVTQPDADAGWRATPARLAFALRQSLVAGDVDFAARKPTSLWSNRIVLPGLSVMDDAKYDSEAKLENARVTLSLRGRNLEGAVLIGATLRKVDFTAARLNSASFDDADLRGATFGCALEGRDGAPPEACTQLVGTFLRRSNLAGSDMVYANLRNAVLDDASMPGALLDHAILAGASLVRTNLERGNLGSVDLSGAYLNSTNLKGAEIAHAMLQGANISGSHLQGALLLHTNLLGASLQATDLQGATLDQADLRAADMSGTRLRAASLRSAQMIAAQLHGADLTAATLDAAELAGATLPDTSIVAASLAGAFVWRADEAPRRAASSFAADLQIGPQRYCARDRAHPSLSLCDWQSADVEKLRAAILESVPTGVRRDEAMKRVSEQLDPAKVFVRDDPVRKSWEELVQSSLDRQTYARELADEWGIIGCEAAGAPYVAAALLDRLSELDQSVAPVVARRFADEATCPGAHGLSDAGKAKIQAVLANAGDHVIGAAKP